MDPVDITSTGSTSSMKKMMVAVVIPCYRVTRHILAVLDGIPAEIDHIFVVDDACPERTGELVKASRPQRRITILTTPENRGVGGAVVTGYRRALAEGYDIIVKMDGDGQMDPAHLPALIAPLLAGRADYTKGNRFADLYAIPAMPPARILGNAAFSILTKAMSGYWDLMDPTNGYTAIHRSALAALPLDRLAERYFFETDLLFRLATIRAVVADVPIPPRYGDETSHIRPLQVVVDFPARAAIRFVKRFALMYLVRDVEIATAATLLGFPLLLHGLLFGAAASTIIGAQCLFFAAARDIANRPRTPLQKLTENADQTAPATRRRAD